MVIPKQLKIGGHLVTVDQTQDLEESAGDFDVRKGLIRIDRGLPQSHKEAALIHEILCHVINSSLSGSEVGHALLDSMAEQLYQVLSDNKLLK